MNIIVLPFVILMHLPLLPRALDQIPDKTLARVVIELHKTPAVYIPLDLVVEAVALEADLDPVLFRAVVEVESGTSHFHTRGERRGKVLVSSTGDTGISQINCNTWKRRSKSTTCSPLRDIHTNLREAASLLKTWERKCKDYKMLYGYVGCYNAGYTGEGASYVSAVLNIRRSLLLAKDSYLYSRYLKARQHKLARLPQS